MGAKASTTSATNGSDQLCLFAESSPTSQITSDSAEFVSATPGSQAHELRVVHYLGSKLRLLRPIRQAVADIASPGVRICDLFAGSGTVSLCLGTDWDIISADIQEYSRVLCNGLLNPPSEPISTGHAIQHLAYDGILRKRLCYSLATLIDYERECLNLARSGEIRGLCDLVEHGSLLRLSSECEIFDEKLKGAMRESWERLRSEGICSGPNTVITRHFGGVYFSWQQAIDLDTLLASIHKLDDGVRDYFLAAALAVASDVVNTVGKQFAQPIKPRDANYQPKRHLVKQMIRDRSMSVLEGFMERLRQFSSLPKYGRNHQAVKGDYRAVLADRNIGFDAVYADPPYTRDHYSRYYHVLETMSLHDEPEVSTTMIRSVGNPRLSRGHYRVDRHQSPFCIKSQAPGAFEELFIGVASRQVPLVVSYSPYREIARNRPRLTVDELKAIASKYFRSVEVRPVDGVSHNKLNVSARNVAVDYPAEILLVCSLVR